MHCFELIRDQAYMVDIDTPIDISLPISEGPSTNAFHLPPATFTPFRMGDFVGSVEEGGPVRCDIVTVAPHGNGTHTECIGHIAGKGYVLRDCLRSVFTMAQLATVSLVDEGKGLVVSRAAVEAAVGELLAPTLVLRTLPNEPSKRTRKWSGVTPPFIDAEAMRWLVNIGVQHLVVDLPSVDAEEDGGALEAHHIFWQWPETPRTSSTITELVYIPNEVLDGIYGICFGVAPFDGDAAPSTISLFNAWPVELT